MPLSEAGGERQRRIWQRTMLLPVLVALAVVLLAGLFLDRQNQQIAEAQIRAQTMAAMSVIRAKLEGNVAGNIQLVKGLVSVISTEPSLDQTRYNALASTLFEDDSHLRSVAAAPDLVISMTYPLAGNEAAIGLDYRNTPSQWDAVRKVMETGRLIIAGPVDLVQGGKGFVGRFPVYVGEADQRRLWGVVAAVLDVDRLYRDSGLLDPELELDISITGMDGTGKDGARFFGPDLTGLNPVESDVILPSGSWRIAAVPKGGWAVDEVSVWLLRGTIIAAGLLILFPIWLTSRMQGQRHDYVRNLAARESELTRLTRRLNLALEVSKVGVWELDMSTGIETWDERTNELYGFPNDGRQRTEQDWQWAMHPDDRERAQADFQRMIAEGRYESNYRVVMPDATIRHVRSIGALYSEPGRPDRVIGVNWDVTADVTLNEDLRQAKLQAEARNRDLEQARISIEHNAMHDSLTGLPNRRFLDDALSRHARDGYHGSGSLALLHIDLDRFKQINDTLGHAAGDAMLVHASRVLRASCYETDFVARVGGDEFVILCSAGRDDRRLVQMAEHIVAEMRKPVQHEGHECRFGVSVGVAAFRSSDIDGRQLLINADIALYRAKKRGRNRFEFFSEALQAEVIHTKRLADEVLSGLDNRAFVAHYQPQFDAHTLDVVSVEALARWNHPRRGLQGPDQFMAVAEELNVMAQIDRIVLDDALRDMARWDEMGVAIPRVSVNVSLKRLNDERLIESLKHLPLQAGRLAFELVESIYLDENDGLVAWNIDQIKELGIDVEIDDFGTGYASIVSLQKLHPRRLKIDRQLVWPILDQPAQRQLVASIVDIGKSMDIEIVAEGVETMEHAAILRDLGCDILQGYAFARPMNREALEVFMVEQAWRRAG